MLTCKTFPGKKTIMTRIIFVLLFILFIIYVKKRTCGAYSVKHNNGSVRSRLHNVIPSVAGDDYDRAYFYRQVCSPCTRGYIVIKYRRLSSRIRGHVTTCTCEFGFFPSLGEESNSSVNSSKQQKVSCRATA